MFGFYICERPQIFIFFRGVTADCCLLVHISSCSEIKTHFFSCFLVFRWRRLNHTSANLHWNHGARNNYVCLHGHLMIYLSTSSLETFLKAHVSKSPNKATTQPVQKIRASYMQIGKDQLSFMPHKETLVKRWFMFVGHVLNETVCLDLSPVLVFPTLWSPLLAHRLI